jgi:hypothetical protein
MINGGMRGLIWIDAETCDVGQSKFPVWAAGLEFMAFELPHVILERRMMLGIKALARRHATLSATWTRPRERGWRTWRRGSS